ncbi:bifunctional 4-hydroxy-2-oxoglutarate aldolase/2-dehydro-3-deoxy-phosphogluconate aldolase [Agromyces subbeticus]|uniref:bifunctional 4-hydroxy-2-oxoglutarate aldolase/2-dehydro-3-deoxy-phosphogluconate aldolase n=1 Tax=Agromyces subbeticus TaxID=293890 RepID=UPI0003B6A883|nr:bifunctional 4-hydroxy-2-oxoglutarate aldolase/2-dehydro-3-deoxy-phosphogluconate aldolase [Agromyces subbeticus]
MTTTLETLRSPGIVPVVTIDDPDDIDPIAAGLADGGVRAIEVTLRTMHGVEAIRRISARGDLLVGAGTVLDEKAVPAVAEAGAAFVVSPGLDAEVVDATRRAGLLPVPGVGTATEVQRAQRLGLGQVKLFPVAQLGGLAVVRALHQPFPELLFMPSGGVTAAEAGAYLNHPAVFAVGGSWLVPRGRGEDLYEQVRRRAAETVAALTLESGHG